MLYHINKLTVLFEDDIVDYIGIILHGSLFVTKLFLDGEHSIIQHLKPLNMVGADIACTNTKKNPYFIYAKEGILKTNHNRITILKQPY